MNREKSEHPAQIVKFLNLLEFAEGGKKEES